MYFKRFIGLTEILKFLSILVILCLIALSTNVLWRWNQVFYDTSQRLIERSAPDDVIIVAIDETSLSQIGRWPWRRNIHAELINRLTEENAKLIALDIIFSEPDQRYPEDDRKLVDAVRKSDRVVLPVIVEQAFRGSVLHETLPIPELSEASRGLGHVHIELDTDGIARSLYLIEGLGKPRWPSLNLKLLQLIEPLNWASLAKFKSERDIQDLSPYKWVREYHTKIPFYGPPGHFQSISYQQVLKGQYPGGFFKDRIVFVGVTATGLGDSLPTPVSGLSHAMPGVEVNANIFSALREGIMIRDVGAGVQYIGSLLLILIPVLLYPVLKPRFAFMAAIGVILLIAVISFFLVKYLHIWFSPAEALLTVAFSYPIWSWRRLEYAMKHMDHELVMLKEQPGIVEITRESNFDKLADFISSWLPLEAIKITDAKGEPIFKWGKNNAIRNEYVKQANRWQKISDKQFCYLNDNGTETISCCFIWGGDDSPPEQLYSLLIEIIEKIRKRTTEKATSTLEIIQKRIQELHLATKRQGQLKQFIEDSMNQIADGVLILDYSGNILLSNQCAKKMLSEYIDVNSSLARSEIILPKIQLESSWSWPAVFETIFKNNIEIHCKATIGDKYDLLISVSLLRLGGESGSHAFIISMSDITELMRSERKRNEALSFLSHDLRSPLVSILALTELIENDTDDTNRKKHIKRIEQHAVNSIKLAEDFVQFSRADGNESILFTEVNLADIAANAIDLVWEQAKTKNITINKNLEAGKCYINGNAQLLERVFINLLTNSIKYSEQDTLINVTVNSGSCVKCVIQDQGRGIPEKDLPTIMNRFTRSESEGQTTIRGLGLGLAFVKVVVEKHSGLIEINSVVGEGTIVTLQFPKK